MGNHPTFIMLNKEKFPYTPAYHIFHSGFPCAFRRIDVMDHQIAHDMAYTMPLTLGKHDKEDYLREKAEGYLTIAQMVIMFDDGCNFDILRPKETAEDIRQLLHYHLTDWSDGTSFIGMQPDLEGLTAMRKFYSVIEVICRDAKGTVARIARSEFAAALDSLGDFNFLLKNGLKFNDVFGPSPTMGLGSSTGPVLSSETEKAIDAVANGKNVFLDALYD